MRCNWPLLVFSLAGAAILCFFVSGCQGEAGPRLHVSQYFGSPLGVDFEDPEKLGDHHYSFNFGEKNGMIYTCRGGFIDIGHLREAADRTKYAVRVVKKNILEGNEEFSLRMIEPSRYRVSIGYPDGWEDKSEEDKRQIVNGAALGLGQYIAHRSLIWHEILTWYGFSSIGFFPERISSFSPEDSYSDALGTNLAIEALRRDGQRFDENMTELINGKLLELGAVEIDVSKRAVKEIKGQWFSGGMYFFAKIKKHNFDVGMDDGYVTPFLVEGICPDSSGQNCSVPGLGGFSSYGFKVQINIEPRVMEKGKIWRELNFDKSVSCIDPQVHFEMLLSTIIDSKSSENNKDMNYVKQ